MRKDNKSNAEIIFMFLGGVALTVAGIIVIPPLIEKYSNKMYKASLENEEIDFDNIGPEIIPYNEKEGE